MTGKIVRLPPDAHRETQLLLPWFAAGRLDASDRSRVEAHLSGCPRCRAELELEHRLEAEVSDLPLEADLGWAQMLRRIETSGAGASRMADWANRARAPWLGWGAAASFAALFAVVIAIRPAPTEDYHTLSAPASTAPAGDAIVVFRPEASVGEIEKTLLASRAHIVDGPTGAGAYVLAVPAAQRAAALANLRSDKDVVMAEPVDAEGSR